MWNELLLGAASFINVALRSFQQLNVVHDQERWVMPVSMAMAACDAVIIVSYASFGFHVSLVLATGIGAGIGCITSMKVHRRLRSWTKR